MAESGFFKTTTIGGFDKKSVLNYIDSLNEGFHATELEYNKKLDAFGKAQESQLGHIKKLESQLAEQTAKLEAVAKQLEDERALANQAQELIAELDEQNKALQKKYSDNERELQIQIERGRQLQFKAESLDYKSKKYDEVTTQIGDAIIEAKRNADHIVSTANAQAEDIIKQTQSYMKSFYTELGSFKSDSSRLRKSIEEILFVLNDRVDIMQEVVRQVETRFAPASPLDYTEEKTSFEPTNDQAGYFGGSVNENLSH
ncbi:hypothetical protein V6615_02190 [Oscillospiraceae bacterium PP1C4]